MAPKSFEQMESPGPAGEGQAQAQASHFSSLRHKGSTFLQRIRLRSSSDYLRYRAAATPNIPEPVPEIPLVREGGNLTSSSSAMFIARMNEELFLSQFKRAQEAYLSNNLPLCQHRCTELLNKKDLHLDTRVETLQLLATITPFSVAHVHLNEAMCLLDLAVQRGGIEEEQMPGILGLRITTMELLGRVDRELEIVRREEGKISMEEWMAEWKKSGTMRGAESASRSTKRNILYRPVGTVVVQAKPMHGSWV